MSHEEGFQEALRRIEEIKRYKATHIDLAYLELTTIPFELQDCQYLETVNLTGNQISLLRRVDN